LFSFISDDEVAGKSGSRNLYGRKVGGDRLTPLSPQRTFPHPLGMFLKKECFSHRIYMRVTFFG
jgi:hypothetical protein